MNKSSEQRVGGGVLLRMYGVLRSVVLSAFAVLGVVSLLAFVGALILGIKPVVVISGSMEPTIPVGAVIFTQEASVDTVASGDIVTVPRPHSDGLITHRVVEVDKDDSGRTILIMRGDANTSTDPSPYRVDTVGAYKFHVPALGHLTLLMQTMRGWLIVGAVAILLIALYFADPARLLRARSED